MLTKGCTNENVMPAAFAFCTIHDLFRFVETMRQRGTNGDYRLMSKALFDYTCKNHTGSLPNGALVPKKEARNIPDSPALYSLLGGYVRGEGHYLTGSGYTASPRAFYGVGGGSTMWMVDPDRDLTL
ncbi:Beta-lactamase domain-containing protein [Fusarium sp. Ph1]|nr:Beta-lactamase domain-containing protein [Fusarium sp. Ph1]